jgi:hypothetical protein
MPLLAADGAGQPGGVFVFTMGFGGQGPLNASVWLGQPASAPAPSALSCIAVALEQSSSSALSTVFDLKADDSKQVTLDGIAWRYFSARIAGPVLGWVYLAPADTSGGTLYITGPVVVEEPAPASFAAVPGRKPTTLERATTRLAWQELRRRMRFDGQTLGGPRVQSGP